MGHGDVSSFALHFDAEKVAACVERSGNDAHLSDVERVGDMLPVNAIYPFEQTCCDKLTGPLPDFLGLLEEEAHFARKVVFH